GPEPVVRQVSRVFRCLCRLGGELPSGRSQFRLPGRLGPVPERVDPVLADRSRHTLPRRRHFGLVELLLLGTRSGYAIRCLPEALDGVWRRGRQLRPVLIKGPVGRHQGLGRTRIPPWIETSNSSSDPRRPGRAPRVILRPELDGSAGWLNPNTAKAYPG